MDSRFDVSLGIHQLLAGTRVLLSATGLQLFNGRRYALMGRNGVGKTTLLAKIASKNFREDNATDKQLRAVAAGSGLKQIDFPKNVTVGYLRQEVRRFESAKPVVETLVELATERRKQLLEEEIGALEGELDELDPEQEENMEQIQELSDRLGELDGELEDSDKWGFETKAVAVLKGLGFKKKLRATPANELSGGWTQRLCMAEVLLSKPHILLLDEPTNHLDLHGVLWLERFLVSDLAPKTLVVVSHDKTFVNAVCTDVIMMANQKLQYFHGTYAELEAKGQQGGADHLKKLVKRVKQEEKIDQSIANIRKKARNLGKKKTDAAAKMLKQAKQLEKRRERVGLNGSGAGGNKYKFSQKKFFSKRGINRTEAIKLPKADPFVLPNCSGSLPCGKTVPLVQISKASVGYASGGEPVLKNVTAFVKQDARIAVVGPNGAGKTTLIRLLLGDPIVQQSSGQVDRAGGMRIAYVAQDHINSLLDHADQTAAQFLMEKFGVTEQEARSRLGKFGLTGRYSLNKIHQLSGGQKVRVSLTALTWHDPHLVILDEPTNHLDLWSLDALGDALNKFDGAVIVVSHNRTFVQSFCRELWICEKGSLRTIGSEGEDTNAFSGVFSTFIGGVSKKVSNFQTKKADAERRKLGKYSKKAQASTAKLRKNGPKTLAGNFGYLEGGTTAAKNGYGGK